MAGADRLPFTSLNAATATGAGASHDLTGGSSPTVTATVASV